MLSVILLCGLFRVKGNFYEEMYRSGFYGKLLSLNLLLNHENEKLLRP